MDSCVRCYYTKNEINTNSVLPVNLNQVIYNFYNVNIFFTNKFTAI